MLVWSMRLGDPKLWSAAPLSSPRGWWQDEKGRDWGQHSGESVFQWDIIGTYRGLFRCTFHAGPWVETEIIVVLEGQLFSVS